MVKIHRSLVKNAWLLGNPFIKILEKFGGCTPKKARKHLFFFGENKKKMFKQMEN